MGNQQKKLENKRKVFKFKELEHDKKLEKIHNTFYFAEYDTYRITQIFHSIKKKNVTLNDLFNFLQEEQNSVLSLYIYKFYQGIEKEKSDQLTYYEYLIGIIVYCLLTEEKIISFVFNIIDEDHDNIISKRDIIQFLTTERDNKKIFPFNYVKAIDLIQLERPDNIQFEQFRRKQNAIPFLCFPAFTLQKRLQKKILDKENDLAANKKQQKKIKIKEEQEKQQLNKRKEKFMKMMPQFSQIDQNLFRINLFSGQRNTERKQSDGYHRFSQIIGAQPKQRTNSIIYRKKSLNMIQNKEKKIDQVKKQDGSVISNDKKTNKYSQLAPSAGETLEAEIEVKDLRCWDKKTYRINKINKNNLSFN